MRLVRPTIRVTAITAVALLATLTLASSSSAGAPAAHGGRTYFAQYLNGDSAAYRPKALSPQPGPTLYVRHMTWTSWSATQAKGKGVVYANNCTPDCASGHFRHDRATVALGNPHAACGKEFFDKMQLHYTGKKFPSSINRHETYIVQPDMCGNKAAIAPRTGSAGGAPPAVLSCLGRAAVKPADDVTDCDNATTAWRGVTWTSWTADAAAGHGDVYLNNCKPDCASGHFHTFKAKVSLSGVETTPTAGAVFSIATLHYATGTGHKVKTVDLPTAPNQPMPSLKGGEFFSPITGIGCEVDFGKGSHSLREAYCQRVKPTASLTMTPKGKVKRCTGNTCIGDAGENTPTLQYGQVDEIGPFRCLSSRAGVICTVTSGLGFVISTTSLARIKGF